MKHHERQRRKNVIFLHADQLRYDALGCNGNPFADTPHLDALAGNSTVFDRHIVANPVCMPSRACLLTGRYPNGHGLWHNGVALPRQQGERTGDIHTAFVPSDAAQTVFSGPATIADVCGAAGYHTRSIGKLHLTPTQSEPHLAYAESRERWQSGEMLPWHGPYYGFDHVELSIGHGENAIGHYREWLNERFPHVDDNLDAGRHRTELPFPEMRDLYASAIPPEAHHSTWIAERACAFLEDERDPSQPFLLFLGFPDPHHPFTPPRELAEQFEGREVLPVYQGTDEPLDRPEVMQRFVTGLERNLSIRSLSAECLRLVRQYTAAMVHLIDRAVGVVLDALHRIGLDRDTVVIFTSDHGDFLGDHLLLRKDTFCANELVHVPLIISAPHLELPSKYDGPMSNVDVLPTLCECIDLPIPPGVQGQSVLPALRGGLSHRVQVMGYMTNPRYHNFSVYDDRFRFTWYPGTGERELYDHRSDPHELVNRAGHPPYAPDERRLYAELLELHTVTDNPAAGRIAMH